MDFLLLFVSVPRAGGEATSCLQGRGWGVAGETLIYFPSSQVPSHLLSLSESLQAMEIVSAAAERALPGSITQCGQLKARFSIPPRGHGRGLWGLALRSCVVWRGPLSLSVPQCPWCVYLSIKSLAPSLAQGRAH